MRNKNKVKKRAKLKNKNTTGKRAGLPNKSMTIERAVDLIDARQKCRALLTKINMENAYGKNI